MIMDEAAEETVEFFYEADHFPTSEEEFINDVQQHMRRSRGVTLNEAGETLLKHIFADADQNADHGQEAVFTKEFLDSIVNEGLVLEN